MTPGLLIVCHAAPEWGFGHLHRSLAMAAVAHDQGWKVHLVTRGPKALIDARVPSSLVTRGVHQCATLASEFKCLREAREALWDSGTDRLRIVVDHPHLDASYAEGLALLGIPWLTFSQSPSPPGPPDWVVSPLTAEEQGVQVERGNTHWLQGPAYAVLRPVFRGGCLCPYQPLSERQRLLVTFGGGSDFGAGKRLLTPILEAFPELDIEVVTTRSNENLPHIEAQVGYYDGRLRLTVEPEEVAVPMCKAGAAVTAGGTTTVELAALGIPFVTVAVASNQEAPARAWESRGVSLHAGNVDDETLVDRLLTYLRRLLSDPDECLERSHRALKCVDGLGAQRILNHLIEEV